MPPTQKVKYLRIPVGLLFLFACLLLVSFPYRSRRADPAKREMPVTWKECVLLYFTAVGTFFTVLFLWENVLAILRPGPRRLSLTNDYINANPKKVDFMEAFVYDTPVTVYEQVKFYFFTFSGVAFIRLFVMIASFFVGTALFCIGGKCGRQKRPRLFYFWANGGVFCGHLGLAAAGIYNIRHYGRVSDRSECKLLIGNHSCVIEVLLMFMMNNFPSFVSRRENTKMVLFSTLCEVADAILVDRDAASSRKQTLDTIVARARNPKAPQLMVFPEGTTGNQNTLFLFKKGAFEAGEPIQMICFSFPYKHFNPAWTGRAVGGNSMPDILLRLSCQFVNHAELRVLPVYYPTEAEKADAILYADHCQKMMATVLRANVSDATYSNYQQAEKFYAEHQTAERAPHKGRS